jgi:cytochrome c oxidase cbb3-type subunit 3
MKRYNHYKLIYPAIMLAILPQQAWAQTSQMPDTHSGMFTSLLYLIAVAAILGGVIVAGRLVLGILEMMHIDIQKANGAYVEPEPVEDPIDKFFRSLSKNMSDAVPLELEAAIDTGHDYDGIRELDNNLPPWWKMMFYASIVFSVIYMYYYHMGGDGRSIEEDYAIEVEDAHIANLEYLAKQANKVDENSVAALTDAGSIEAGKTTFITSCAACHGNNAEGNVGPNLTDEFWLHGGNVHDVFKTVKYGVPAKGMIAWEAQLNPVKMQQVVSYVLSLQGSAPVNAKAPQGDRYVPVTDSIPAVVDTAKTAMK